MTRNQPKLVGIIGKAGTGKDTLADFFVNDNYTKMAMADPLKHICQILFDFTSESLWGPSEHRSPKVRKTLQLLGTEVARTIDPSVWVKQCNKRINAFFSNKPDPFNKYITTQSPTGIVFSDIRFPNEASFLHERGAILIKIERTLAHQKYKEHTSELTVNNIPDDIINYKIMNNGTLDELLKMYQLIAEAENVISNTSNKIKRTSIRAQTQTNI